jgi:hypothetical protein
MSDLVERLRKWVHAVDAVPASDLMDEAANEIERLRLTDAEREAISYYLATGGPYCIAATLRGLLERLS